MLCKRCYFARAHKKRVSLWSLPVGGGTDDCSRLTARRTAHIFTRVCVCVRVWLCGSATRHAWKSIWIRWAEQSNFARTCECAHIDISKSMLMMMGGGGAGQPNVQILWKTSHEISAPYSACWWLNLRDMRCARARARAAHPQFRWLINWCAFLVQLRNCAHHI